MKYITDFIEINELFKKYRNASVDIFMFNLSLRRIVLKLEINNKKDALFVIGISSKYIESKFSFINKNLEVINRKVDGKLITEIKDDCSNFSLLTTGGVTVIKGLEYDFVKNFN